MLAVTIALLIVAGVLFLAVGISEAFWRSDSRRRRAFVRDNEAQR